jgi:enediyne biosynthesis protein E4
MLRSPFIWLLAVAIAGTAGGLGLWLSRASPVVQTELRFEDDSSNRQTGRIQKAVHADLELPAGVNVHFTDVTEKSGIHFVHFDGHTDHEYIMETLGPGVGWLDYDQDGLLDLFLVQGSTFVPPHGPSPTCKLFKNLGGGKFKDVTEEVGLGHAGCGMGVAVGDIDNDGFPDLFLTCFGKPNVLFHNEPIDPTNPSKGRHFVDITAKTGMAAHPDWEHRPNFSTSAAFLDYNSDGYLDLFVCSYVKVDLEHYPECKSSRSGKRFSCQPSMFEPTRCLLYRNNGDNTFTEVGKEAGIDVPQAKALGVVALDLDDDGRIDVFVANDGMPNFFFRNKGDGRFESVGPRCGCTVNSEGGRQAYMGVDAEDLTGNGLADLFVTAFSQETNTLFRNLGRGHFEDATRGSGLGPPSWLMLGFGACFLDVDLDGRPDIVVVNGHVSRFVDDEGDRGITFKQKAQVFYNRSKGRFMDISPVAGPFFQHAHVGRGLAPADFDNDGRMDLAITNNGEDALLLHNESTTPNHWIRLYLEGSRHRDPKGSNRDAVGAKVTLDAGGRKLVRHRKGGGSYLSAGDPRLLIGLGTAKSVDHMEVRWPSGMVQRLDGPFEADRGYRIREGKAEWASEP